MQHQSEGEVAMAQRTEEANETKVPAPVSFPRMLSLEQVQEILNLGLPEVSAMVRSGELRALQFFGRNIWRVREDDLAAYVDAAYAKMPVNESSELILNLAALDKGTAAHEATVTALSRTLERRGFLPQRPGCHAPAFDLGWTENGVVYIAEVKSLTGTDQTQQIWLGLGQVLDCAQQIRQSRLASSPVHPVLVLEHEPNHPRWTETASSAGVELIWGPTFIKHERREPRLPRREPRFPPVNPAGGAFPSSPEGAARGMS